MLYPIEKLNYLRETAAKLHADVNQQYGKKLPYSYHLDMAAQYASLYGHLLNSNDEVDAIIGCFFHDSIEDARISYNDLVKIVGKRIANAVYAVSNEKGKTRAERANAKYYRGIRNTELATYVKLCDRLANVNYSKTTKSSMLSKYKKENNKFEKALYDPKFEIMFAKIREFLELDKPKFPIYLKIFRFIEKKYCHFFGNYNK